MPTQQWHLCVFFSDTSFNFQLVSNFHLKDPQIGFMGFRSFPTMIRGRLNDMWSQVPQPNRNQVSQGTSSKYCAHWGYFQTAHISIYQILVLHSDWTAHIPFWEAEYLHAGSMYWLNGPYPPLRARWCTHWWSMNIVVVHYDWMSPLRGRVCTYWRYTLTGQHIWTAYWLDGRHIPHMPEKQW